MTCAVALHPEGVDRNLRNTDAARMWLLSPSTRRAWIEIPCDVPLSAVCEVSPSTRRAWIEIIMAKATAYQLQSPSTRRAWIEIPCMNEESSGVLRRPPPGGRG